MNRLTKKDWLKAHQIASELAAKGTDVNELAKLFVYLRTRQSRSSAVSDFMKLMARLPKARAFVRSGQTLQYFQDIQNVCGRVLVNAGDAGKICEILGWSVRLLRFYRLEPARPRRN